MPKLRNFFSRPEYIFRPTQGLKRIWRLGKSVPSSARVILPWNAQIAVNTGEAIGSAIYYYGIFDKIVPEAIWRLLDAGEMAIEIGANIGQNCSAMAARAGQGGRVLAFEPHPDIFHELEHTCAAMRRSGFASIQIENIALGKCPGVACLITGDEFERNRGCAALHDLSPQQSEGIQVTVRSLDEYLKPGDSVGVCKIDVEGKELDVLRGAEQALSRRAIRDIIFEDFTDKPSLVTDFLERNGFTVFELHDTWWKPRLLPLAKKSDAPRGFSYNYLATLDASRAIKRFRMPGWRCLLTI